MSGNNRQSRNAAGLTMSAILHLLLIGVIINQRPPDYQYFTPQATPEQPAPIPEPAIDVTIIKLQRLPPKIPPTPQTEPTPPAPQVVLLAQPVVPAHPKVLPPTPPAPAPPPPSPPQPTAKPAPTPLPAPAKPAPAEKPAPAPVTAVIIAPSAPIQSQPKPAQVRVVAAPSLLNIHKAALPVPSGAPTLPMSPAAGAKGPAGAPPTGAPTTTSGGSRLSGLNPYPNGFMPSGGGGLRGTLVGCANAEAVRLSSVERDKCNERFGVDVAGAPKLDPLSPTKRAAFDKAAASQAGDQKYRASTTDLNFKPSDPGGIAHGPASTETFKHNAGDTPNPNDPH